MLSGGHENFHDAAGNGRIDIGLHFHGFESEKFCAAFHRVIGLRGDAADYAGSWGRDLAGIGGGGVPGGGGHPPTPPEPAAACPRTATAGPKNTVDTTDVLAAELM